MSWMWRSTSGDPDPRLTARHVPRLRVRPPSTVVVRGVASSERAPAAEPELTEDDGCGAEAGDGRLEQVEPDDGGQQQPPRCNQSHEQSAEQGHGAGEEEYGAVEGHALPSKRRLKNPVPGSWGWPAHRSARGTRARTWSTCWPQPAQVVLPHFLQEIGRASCRESVCPYV